jgi:hypothetical protein
MRATEASDRGRAARYVVFGLAALFLLLASAFTIGTALQDPGGATAVVLTLAWVVPAVGFSVFALLRPAHAEQVLMAVTAVVAAFVIVQALTDVVPVDDVGPVGTIVCLALAVPLAVLGLHRPAMAGKLLLVVGVTLALSGLLGSPAGSARVVAAPLLLFGLLFLWVAGPQGGSHRRSAPPSARPTT